jgi:hypothetical protein
MIRLSVLGLLALLALSAPASARVFDLTTEFQPAANPNGNWSYYAWSNGSSLFSGSYLLGWQPETFRSGGPGFGGYPTPSVFQFPGSSAVFSWPSFFGGLAIVFTMPYDSTVSLTASSTISGDNPSINLDFGINGVLIAGSGPAEARTWAYDSMGAVLSAGTRIYLQQGSAGCCGQYTYNSMTITLEDVPEPSAALLLLSFLSAGGAASALRKARRRLSVR